MAGYHLTATGKNLKLPQSAPKERQGLNHGKVHGYAHPSTVIHQNRALLSACAGVSSNVGTATNGLLDPGV
jgi:hypothetical protein